MQFVYLLKSQLDTHQRYIGVTCDLARRLYQHNSGSCTFTRRYKP